MDRASIEILAVQLHQKNELSSRKDGSIPLSWEDSSKLCRNGWRQRAAALIEEDFTTKMEKPAPCTLEFYDPYRDEYYMASREVISAETYSKRFGRKF